jgi:uncharacterized membrane protein
MFYVQGWGREESRTLQKKAAESYMFRSLTFIALLAPLGQHFLNLKLWDSWIYMLSVLLFSIAYLHWKEGLLPHNLLKYQKTLFPADKRR